MNYPTTHDTNIEGKVVKDTIDIGFIQKHLPSEHNCEWIESVSSTQSAVNPNSLLIAEHQTAGMGRRGKQWLTPKGRSICLSYRFKLPLPVTQMAGYQITTALAIVDTIIAFNPEALLQLKWPNDLYHHGKKFAGILINLIPKHQQTELIIGIGINWQLTIDQIESIDQPVCNIPLFVTEEVPKRHQFIAQLIHNIDNNNYKFIHHGLGYFLPTWQQHDYLLNKTIQATTEGAQLVGQYLGINQQGELLLETSEGIKTFCSGEVSVKAV